ncbi:MAG: hypothetical protein U0U69_00820 [Acidimicrobiia bacterium]
MKRYEASYANQVLVALAASAADGVVEKSVRQLAQESGVSASAVQIGLTALRRAGRIRTRKKGAAGRPSVIELLSTEPLADGDGSVRPPAYGPGGQLADAFVERYEKMLLELDSSRPAEVERLEARVAELEAENAELRAKLDPARSATGKARRR